MQNNHVFPLIPMQSHPRISLYFSGRAKNQKMMRKNMPLKSVKELGLWSPLGCSEYYFSKHAPFAN